MKTTTTKNYKLLKRVRYKNFEVDNLHQYDFYIFLGNRDLQFAVSDSLTEKYILLEDYAISEVDNYKEFVAILENLFDTHDLAKAGFWKSIKIGIKNDKFSFIPSDFFDSDYLFDYLRLNCNVDSDTDKLLYYKHFESDVVNCFAVNNEVFNWFKSIYSDIEIKFIHQSSALIEGVLAQLSHYSEDSTFVFVDRFKLHIISYRNKKIEYYNQFLIKKFQDYVESIMQVFNGLKRNNKTTNIILWGYIGKESAHYREFIKYIKHVSFGERPQFHSYSFEFDEIQDHYFFDTYNLHLCK